MILEIDVRLDYGLEGLATVLLQFEAASTADQRILSTETLVTDALHFSRVPAEEGVGERAWLKARDRLDIHYRARVEIDRPAVDLATLAQTLPEDLPPETIKFMMGSRYVPSEKFQGFVEAEFGDLEGGARIVAMRDWIERSFSYVRGSSTAETTAIDTFVERQGICRDYAHVMIALSRAAGIPARMVSVYAPSVEPPDFHAVAEVFLDGGWHLIDATGMAAASEIMRIGVGRDAGDIAFMQVFGASEINDQSVMVRRA